MTNKNEDSDRLADEARSFLANFKTLLMSTVDSDGVPHASYAPFVRTQDDCFYIYVSGLSRHTSNLESRGTVSVLFIADERDANQLFARRRLTFDCHAELVPRESQAWEGIMAVFSAKFGDVMDLIRPLADFKLFRIRPQTGTYVRGFGEAYRTSGPELDSFKHIRTSDTSSKKQDTRNSDSRYK